MESPTQAGFTRSHLRFNDTMLVLNDLCKHNAQGLCGKCIGHSLSMLCNECRALLLKVLQAAISSLLEGGQHILTREGAAVHEGLHITSFAQAGLAPLDVC